jgi:hypothetical protein
MTVALDMWLRGTNECGYCTLLSRPVVFRRRGSHHETDSSDEADDADFLELQAQEEQEEQDGE